MTDFVQVTTGESAVPNAVVGNFCVMGTVLVKSWEPELKRYVMIRRPARMPLFSPSIKPPEIMSGLGITDSTKAQSDINAVMSVSQLKDSAGTTGISPAASAGGSGNVDTAIVTEATTDTGVVSKIEKAGGIIH